MQRLPGAEWRPHPRPGYGPHRVLGGWKLVIHGTDSLANLDAEVNYNNKNKTYATYQLLLAPAERRVAQQAEFGQYVGGMKNPDRALIDTNGSRCIQVCILGKSAQAHQLPVDQLDWIGEVLAPLVREFNIPNLVVDLNTYGPAFSYTAAKSTTKNRQFWQPYKTFEHWTGWTMHGNVPLNDHWDHGWIDLKRVANTATRVAFPPAPPAPVPTPVPSGPTTPIFVGGTSQGYWMTNAKGLVVPKGGVKFLGDLSKTPLNGVIVDGISTPSGNGYWLLGQDGGVFSFGDAGFFGSVPGALNGQPMNSPATRIRCTPSGRGYWISAAGDGGVFTFGDAQYHGNGR